MIFRFFENLLDPFPAGDPKRPPGKFVPFIRHYVIEALPLLLIMAFTSAVIAVAEVLMFGFVGLIIDWMNTLSPQQFWEKNAARFYGWHRWSLSLFRLRFFYFV